MTSSLVGSEMCIRDSYTQAAAGKGASGGVLHGGSAAGPEGGVGARPTTCLLYTSDAADDM
eukprot:12446611-Prorocentrum_lima.AAC.1